MDLNLENNDFDLSQVSFDESELGIDFSVMGDDADDNSEIENEVVADEDQEQNGDTDESVEYTEEFENETENEESEFENEEDSDDNIEIDDEIPGEEEPSEEQESPLSPYVAAVVEEGILPNLNVEDLKGKSSTEIAEAIIAAQKEQIDSGINNAVEEYKNSLDERQKSFLDWLSEGLPIEQYQELKQEQEAYNSVTKDALETDSELQKAVIKESLVRHSGLDEKRVDRLIESFEDEGTLYEEASKEHDKIIEIANKKEAEIKAEQQKRNQQMKEESEKRLNEFKSMVESTEEIFKGYKIDKSERKKLYDLVVNPVSKNPNTGEAINAIMEARMKDPLGFAIKEAYLFEKGILNGDLSFLESKGKSKAIESLTNAIEESKKPTFKGNNKKNHPQNKKSDVDYSFFREALGDNF